MSAPIDPSVFAAAMGRDFDRERRKPRWLVRRKAEAAAAMIRAEAIPVEAACRHFGVSTAQFEGHQRSTRRFG